MVRSAPPEDSAPPIAKGTAEIIQQAFSQNQWLMRLLFDKYGKSGRKNTNIPPTTFTGPRQGKPCHQIPAYFDKYFWTHGRGSHKGVNCNSKAPGHKDKATMESGMDGRNYRCAEWWCGTLPKLATNNNRNILLKSTESALVPPNNMSYKHAVLKK